MPDLGGNMFTCNNYNLLVFTYYLKVFIASCMTVIPLIYFEKVFIKLIKYKKENGFINKYYLKKQIKLFFPCFIIFLLAFILHNTLNNNVCYSYSSKAYRNYFKVYNSLKNKDLDLSTKNDYLENAITLNNNIKENENEEVKVEEIKKDTLNLNETDYNKQNKVYVIDGVFYYPQYRYGNYNTYSGTTCSSNLERDGYNNPFGYNNYFYIRLNAFIEEASKNGYKITMSGQGCRNYNTQVKYYNTMTRGRAAPPGYSLHGFGIASDLEFYQSDGSVCGYGRNDYNCPSMGWAHANASKFGLTFPLLNASYREDWHIEVINKIKY